ncbi:hypothetical protein SH2C18_45440 [Clostridium sediminicola]|uniref:hypothetical protein n=1 Tax=Clostridium sediminicola TaxID=3114879 RepID=UPI0031F1C81F
MGAWGTGIFEDDTTCDVRDDFIDYLEEGLSAEEATQIIINEYSEEFDVEDDLEGMSLVYIGLAAIQIEKGCLREDIRYKAINLIERGADLALWEESDKESYEERKKVLDELKEKLHNSKL